MEKTFILQVLENSGWKIEGRAGAASRLDLKPSTLRYRMKKLRISRPNA
jgi:transcriptional regulator with GAF, ATPase, and Fis domain